MFSRELCRTRPTRLAAKGHARSRRVTRFAPRSSVSLGSSCNPSGRKTGRFWRLVIVSTSLALRAEEIRGDRERHRRSTRERGAFLPIGAPPSRVEITPGPKNGAASRKASARLRAHGILATPSDGAGTTSFDSPATFVSGERDGKPSRRAVQPSPSRALSRASRKRRNGPNGGSQGEGPNDAGRTDDAKDPRPLTLAIRAPYVTANVGLQDGAGGAPLQSARTGPRHVIQSGVPAKEIRFGLRAPGCFSSSTRAPVRPDGREESDVNPLPRPPFPGIATSLRLVPKSSDDRTLRLWVRSERLS